MGCWKLWWMFFSQFLDVYLKNDQLIVSENNSCSYKLMLVLLWNHFLHVWEENQDLVPPLPAITTDHHLINHNKSKVISQNINFTSICESKENIYLASIWTWTQREQPWRAMLLFLLFISFLCRSFRKQNVVEKDGAEVVQQWATERPMGEESSERGGPVQTGGWVEEEKFPQTVRICDAFSSEAKQLCYRSLEYFPFLLLFLTRSAFLCRKIYQSLHTGPVPCQTSSAGAVCL